MNTMKTRHVIAKVGELAEGQMKTVEVGEHKLLLCRVGGQYRAFPSECPHHGAPLAEGVLAEGRIRCPWHQSIFDALSGELVDPPSLDALTPLEVEIVGENVTVLLPKDYPASLEPKMASQDREEDVRDIDRQGTYVASGPTNETLRQGRTFVIVGAGAAGSAAAEALRQEGFRGNITMITAESHLPYDRTELSKRAMAKENPPSTTLRKGSFYDEHDIDILYESTVEKLDLADQTIHFAGGSELQYDAVLLATGSRPRRLDVPGSNLGNIFTLRSKDDHAAIVARAKEAKHVTLVGGSFIGMEVAASLSQRGLQAEIVETAALPFASKLGQRVGRLIQSVHEKEGTKFHLGAEVESFDGDAGVEAVVLQDGRRIQTDMVIVGIGVEPVTGYIEGVERTEDGGLCVDAQLRCGPHCFAAGDICRLMDWRGDGRMRIEHWRYAQQTGRLAAANMLGQERAYQGVPFFWTKQHGMILQYVGYCSGWDDVQVDGEIEKQDFVAYLMQNGRAQAAIGSGRDAQMCLIAEGMLGHEAMSPEGLMDLGKAKA